MNSVIGPLSYCKAGVPAAAGSDSFVWDELNRLASLTIGGVTTSYAYNGDGLRDSTTGPGGTIHYTWDVASKVPSLLRDGSLNYVYGLNRIMSMDGSGVVSYYLYDGLGSVANVTDASGNVVCSYTYDAFGAVRTQTGSASNYWGFAGEQRDAESGYIYLRNRYYDTDSGRFLSLDPKGNGYPYAAGNPVNFTDPSGLQADCGGASVENGVDYSVCYVDEGGTPAYVNGTCEGNCPIPQGDTFNWCEVNFCGCDYTCMAQLQPQGAAPADDASNTTAVVTDVSTDSPGAGASTDGGTVVVNDSITAPGTGDGGLLGDSLDRQSCPFAVANYLDCNGDVIDPWMAHQTFCIGLAYGGDSGAGDVCNISLNAAAHLDPENFIPGKDFWPGTPGSFGFKPDICNVPSPGC